MFRRKKEYNRKQGKGVPIGSTPYRPSLPRRTRSFSIPSSRKRGAPTRTKPPSNGSSMRGWSRCATITSWRMPSARENAPSLPVGYERLLTLHPLDFEEYLWAAGYDDSAIDTLRGYFERLDSIPQSVHSKMMGLLREYLAIGGMPAVVKMFRQNRDYGEAHQAQSMLHQY